MILRPYQVAACGGVRRSLDQFDASLLVMATGLGKTVVFSHLAHEWPTGRVLVLAHREELVNQAVDKLLAVSGERPAVEMADEGSDESSWWRSKIVVGSVQTLSREKRRQKFRPAEFGLVIVDEAHHAVASTYKGILAHFSRSKHLGVTAWPGRGDGLALRDVFDDVAYEYGLLDAIEDGWLVPVRQRVVRIHGLDFTKVRQTCGDLNEADLDAAMTQEKVLHQVAAPACELIGSRPTLVFCVSVKHARLMSAIINRYRDGASRWLCGDTPADERFQAVEAFRRGDLPILCNCGLFTEGFDAPPCAAVVMARPTKSIGLYVQMIGRGTRSHGADVDGAALAHARRQRIAASQKPDLLVLDFAGNAGRHKIISAEDVLGGRFTDEARAYHKKNPPEEPAGEDVQAALERAAAEQELEIEQEEWRKQLTASAAYDSYEESPFEATAGRRQVETYRERPTKAQAERLLSWGYDEAFIGTLTKKTAGFLIGTTKRGQRAHRES